MELLVLLAYTSVCIAVFALLRIPLTRVSVPVASIGGLVLVFALLQALNFYYPYTDSSGQYSAKGPQAPDAGAASSATGDPTLVAWFSPNSRFRFGAGAAAEVTFDSIPGKVFSASLRGVLATPGNDRVRAIFPDSSRAANQPGIPVLLAITDPGFEVYRAGLPGAARARAAVYGEDLPQLGLLRQTLMRMSAWLNYLSPVSLFS